MKLFTKFKTAPSIIVLLLFVFVKLIQFTLKKNILDKIGVFDQEKTFPVIITFWHNRLLFGIGLFPLWFRQQTVALASKSRDGAYATKFTQYFGVTVERGSTSKGGMRALIKMKKHLERDKNISLTVDGPRGPKYKVQMGAIFLAEKTGVPILPVLLNSSSYWSLGGWDNMQIPKPFSEVTMKFGDPIYIKNNLNTLQREEVLKEVEEKMLELTEDKK